ncbi:RluA family pseudouridine synthase [Mycoplasmopsis meleagridis]|uniref:RluA family pseudouridine synthase n=1 Tax=Mycoplasmopsis meleagridis TaxID=29561 RepID=UPI00073D5A46|nr:RluA family pseudouridine synthase [Mycoplasmopsis meleagridis]KUH47537.1 pseudouridine synthase [Mycoplasmopsis meleagridis]
MIKLIVSYKERIDKYISSNSQITRNDAKELVLSGCVFVNDNIKVIKPNFEVKENDEIIITKLIDKVIDIPPKNIKLDIVYEDDYIVVINKPSGMVVHPAPGHYDDTLVNGLLHHFKNNLSNENGLLRPGIVHRIDKDTSGLLIVAKNNEIHNLLAKNLKNHEIERSYLAIVVGQLENKKIKINLPLKRNENDFKLISVNKNGKEAITHIELLKSFYINEKPYSLIKCDLKTGRTHQIRVHLAYIKHPVYGDPIYGHKIDGFGQRLHAYKLKFIHPKTLKKIEIYAKVPKEFNVAEYNYNDLLKEGKSEIK